LLKCRRADLVATPFLLQDTSGDGEIDFEEFKELFVNTV
jgi:hypothetical protein